MTIIRAEKTSNFSILSNEAAEQASLSFQARGVLWYLLTKPDEWQVMSSDLVSNSPHGEEFIRSALKELDEAGYLYRARVRGARGKIEWQTHVFETIETRQEWDGEGAYQVVDQKSMSASAYIREADELPPNLLVGTIRTKPCLGQTSSGQTSLGSTSSGQPSSGGTSSGQTTHIVITDSVKTDLVKTDLTMNERIKTEETIPSSQVRRNFPTEENKLISQPEEIGFFDDEPDEYKSLEAARSREDEDEVDWEAIAASIELEGLEHKYSDSQQATNISSSVKKSGNSTPHSAPPPSEFLLSEKNLTGSYVTLDVPVLLSLEDNELEAADISPPEDNDLDSALAPLSRADFSEAVKSRKKARKTQKGSLPRDYYNAFEEAYNLNRGDAWRESVGLSANSRLMANIRNLAMQYGQDEVLAMIPLAFQEAAGHWKYSGSKGDVFLIKDLILSPIPANTVLCELAEKHCHRREMQAANVVVDPKRVQAIQSYAIISEWMPTDPLTGKPC